MSLFINSDRHPQVYKSDAKIIAPNQDVFKRDSVMEMIEAQKRANDSLRHSFKELKESHIKQARIESRRMVSVRYNLEQLNDRYLEQQKMGNDMANVLEKYSEKNEELSLKMTEQIELQQETVSQISKQENFQHEVISRLEKQEALTEKMMRKMDHFRLVFYERTNLLAEKIEKGYSSTSAYIHKVMTVRKEPMIREEKEKSLD